MNEAQKTFAELSEKLLKKLVQVGIATGTTDYEITTIGDIAKTDRVVKVTVTSKTLDITDAEKEIEETRALVSAKSILDKGSVTIEKSEDFTEKAENKKAYHERIKDNPAKIMLDKRRKATKKAIDGIFADGVSDVVFIIHQHVKKGCLKQLTKEEQIQLSIISENLVDTDKAPTNHIESEVFIDLLSKLINDE